MAHFCYVGIHFAYGTATINYQQELINMPSRILPDSVPAIFRCLTTARDKWNNTSVAERAISDDQNTQLQGAPTAYLNRLGVGDQALRLALAEQMPLTTDLKARAAATSMLVSHFHQVLDLGVVRGRLAAGARGYYGRDVHATTIPSLETYQEIAEAAANIATGELARFAAEGAGYIAMSMPSAAEVNSAAELFTAALAASAAAQTKTNAKQEVMQALLREGLALTADIYDTVEFFYRKDPVAGSRRAKCRAWGVVYSYGAGETAPVPEPADAAPLDAGAGNQP